MPARHPRTIADDPGRPTIDDCTCIRNCANTADACHHSGHWHTHPRDEAGQLGPCPFHHDAPAGP